MRKRLMSMRTRILLVILCVVLVVFIIITAVFNVLINNHISKTATDQLLAAATMQNHLIVEQSGQGVAMPDLSNAPPSRFNTRPAVFIMDSSYTAYTPVSASAADKQTAREIAGLIKAKHIDPNNISGLQVSTGSSTYFINSINRGSDEYMVFYVDVSGIVNFAHSVNLFLALIMLAVITITFFVTAIITRHLTRPLAHLTEFSKRIGQGDFAPCTEKFNDRELATLADSMNHAASQLDCYDKDQKIFFQNASHELRTPLMSIKVYAEGIAYGIMDVKKASGTILNEADRLSEMVEDLLTISRIDNITKEQKLVDCDLRELLAAAAEEQRSIAEKNNLNFIFNFDAAAVNMQVNDKTIYRAFSNLISNTLRYAKNEIVLTCKKDNHRIVLCVADDGDGIAPEDVPHIFERFYKGQGGKHGIGLSIVKSVVEQHGGDIKVKSDHTGTTFTIFFNEGAI